MINKIRKILTDKSIRKFIIVGLISFGIDYVLLLILQKYFGLQINIAGTVAYLTGLLANFTLNKVWTFGAAGGARQTTKQAFQYAALVCVNLLFTNLILSVGEMGGIGAEFSKPFATGAIMVFNYIVYQRVIFIGKPPIEPFAG